MRPLVSNFIIRHWVERYWKMYVKNYLTPSKKYINKNNIILDLWISNMSMYFISRIIWWRIWWIWVFSQIRNIIEHFDAFDIHRFSIIITQICFFKNILDQGLNRGGWPGVVSFSSVILEKYVFFTHFLTLFWKINPLNPCFLDDSPGVCEIFLWI